ncbi:hypothetical protein NVV94_10485 [Pseudomonas sp. LS1212]|nr:hypothetical protein [Pseudomonas sp. LS1212]UVJ45926.1 hypothetical protein NVV94_10485 [Pseudomonas sp. LS1212]
MSYPMLRNRWDEARERAAKKVYLPRTRPLRAFCFSAALHATSAA